MKITRTGVAADRGARARAARRNGHRHIERHYRAALGALCAKAAGPFSAPNITGTASKISTSISWSRTRAATYADDGNGSPANFGINQGANPDVNVVTLTQTDAKQILHDRYWVASGADRLPPELAAIHGDTAINMGVRTANELLALSNGDPSRYLELRDRQIPVYRTKPIQTRRGICRSGWRATAICAISAARAKRLLTRAKRPPIRTTICRPSSTLRCWQLSLPLKRPFALNDCRQKRGGRDAEISVCWRDWWR